MSTIIITSGGSSGTSSETTLFEAALKCAKMLGRVDQAGTSITDLEDEIKEELRAAITFYNRKPYHLTEFRGGEITTVSGQNWYSTIDLTNGAGDQDLAGRTAVDVKNVMRILYMRDENSGLEEGLKRLDYLSYERLFEGSTPSGRPDYFTVYGGQIGIWPTPDDAYTIYLSAHVKPVLPTDDSDTSVWFDDALELMTSAACKRVCLNYTRDAQRAQEFAALEEAAERSLHGEHIRKSATGRIKSHD